MAALGKIGTKLGKSKGALQNLGTRMTTGKGFGLVLGRSFCCWRS